MKLHILKPGALTTVQDSGRYGCMEYGITTAGVMDAKSYSTVNRILGNEKNAAVLECTLLGPEIQFEGNGWIAFAGADMQARLDGDLLQQGKKYRAEDGQTLSFSMACSGLRTYLGVAGGINVPVVLGSRSTDMKCVLGGYNGRKLQAGDVLECFEKTGEAEEDIAYEAENYGTECCVRVILGPQDDYFTEKDIEHFLTQEYTVTAESDRMGLRLNGPILQGRSGMDIVSDGITFGSIQVTSKGLPIILMADHQTTGGYAKIATVVTEDLWVLAQARPGTKIRFHKVTTEQMQKKSIFAKVFHRKKENFKGCYLN